MKKQLAVIVFVVGATFQMQAQSPDIAHGTYNKEDPFQRRVGPYSYLREADVMWAKRIWRHIDLNEKINAPLRFPKTNETRELKNLINVIMDAVKEGRLTAFDPQDDEFTLPMTLNEFSKVGDADSITIRVARPDPPYIEIDTVIFRAFNPDDVIQYRIKEEWFFDKQRSEMKCRIIGICPMVLARDQEGNLTVVKKNYCFGCILKRQGMCLPMPKLRIVLILHKE
jgi:gliding motility associated protien GldN